MYFKAVNIRGSHREMECEKLFNVIWTISL